MRGYEVDGCAGNRQAGLASAQTVADLASCAGCGTVERLDGGGEVVCFGFQRDNGVDLLYIEHVGPVGIDRIELFDFGPFHKCHIVLVGRYESAGINLRCFLDELEQRHGFFTAVDHESAVENLVTAVLGIDL